MPGNETILLVDDDDAVRGVTRRVLERHGYVVLEARSGHHALSVCSEHGGPIHLILTDLVMPGEDGRRSAEHLVAARADVRILYMSGYEEADVAGNVTPGPEAPFLAKPFTTAELLDKVREALASPRTLA